VWREEDLYAGACSFRCLNEDEFVCVRNDHLRSSGEAGCGITLLNNC
jgi:hypothetical protein